MGAKPGRDFYNFNSFSYPPRDRMENFYYILRTITAILEKELNYKNGVL